MRSMFYRLLAVALLCGLYCLAQAQTNFIGGGFFGDAKVSTSGSTTTFDPSNLGAGNALSNGNLTVTMPAATGFGFAYARSITSHSSGKFYFEITLTTPLFAGSTAIGIANNGAPLQLAFPGFDANLSVACYGATNIQDQGWDIDSATNNNCPSFGSNGDIIGVAVDFNAGLIWIRNTASPTVWNAGGSANPATGVGGQSISAITCPCYAIYSVYTDDGSPQVATGNFGATPYAAIAPSGFGNY